ncbi:CoA ester lyase [Mycobacterium sp.]|uniref:HpcH/HpaI aldolase/citrate lyase family protein n=1 Tax=Mycobacterium sp. TaxID=1785 RepID=UPI0011FBB872|nr:CoA ester lyase [Mycobacterium sp.]TAM72029.1 MAG: CoA ester lyase [Mycobacterium sp.]
MTNLLRRSELAVPASNDNMFDKAAGCGADLVFLDLEDAVPPAYKEESRGKAISALNDLDWGRTARAVRINGLDTRWCHDDVIDVVSRAGRNLDTIIIPKARSARDVWWVDVLLTQLESKLNLGRRIRLEVLIEEVEGLANAEEIAAASPRLDALIFGVGDFSLSQGARVDTNFVPLGEYPGEFWAYARNKVIVAARIAGIDAIDAPYPDYRDLSGYERDARRASLLGYTGKWAIHPDQVPVANGVYAPTAGEIARAEANVAAYREAEANGRGAVGVNGVLVDAAHVKQAEQTLARAALIKSSRARDRR